MALYHFDEGSGDVLKDSSRNGHDGRIVGAKWVKVEKAENGDRKADVAAQEPQRRGVDWALRFSGDGAHVETPVPFDGNHPLTLEAIVQPATQSQGPILHTYLLDLVVTDRSRFQLFGRTLNRQGLAQPLWAGSPQSVEWDRKTHVAGVWDGKSSLCIYVDGTPFRQETPFEGFNGAAGERLLWIAGGQNNPDHFTGIIDEVRISNIVRYTEDFTPQSRFEPDEHTMALYHFDEGSGDVLKDSSGKGHDGKIVGATWVKADEGLRVVDTEADDPDRRTAEWALEFDGESSGVHCPTLEYDGTHPITIEATVSPNSNRQMSIVGTNGFSLKKGETRWQTLCYRLEPSAFFIVSSDEPAHERQVVHLASVFDQRRIQLFVDGERVTDKIKLVSEGESRTLASNERVSGTAIYYPGEGFYLGRANPDNPTQNFFHGIIDEVRISNIARYTEGFTPQRRFEPDEHTMALYHFDEGSGDVLKDSSGNGHDGKIMRATWVKVDEGFESVKASGKTDPQAPPLAVAPFTPDEAKQHQQAWADHLGVPVEFENSIGMKMVLIPPGEFMMGSSEEEIEELLTKFGDTWVSDEKAEWLHSESPQHRVRITRPFRFAAHEITVGQFRQFVEATDYKTEAEADGEGGSAYVRIDGALAKQQSPQVNWRDPGHEQTDQHPVTQVSWADAMAFCDWLSRKEGKTYEPPTEARWEYACRAGSTTHWCFGDAEADCERYGWANPSTAARIGTEPVAQKLSNAFGLFDLHGNVEEWCSDRFSLDYYRSSPQDDPKGLSSNPKRVVRGGAFYRTAWLARSSCRSPIHPKATGAGTGFRPVLLIDTDSPPRLTGQPPTESPKFEPSSALETKTEVDDGDQTPKISWKLRHTLQGHADVVMSVAFHPRGEILVSGSEDGTIRFWDVESGKQLRFIQDIGGVRGLAVSPDGTLLAAVGGFLGAKLWNLSTMQPVGQFSAGQANEDFGAHNGRAIEFSPDGSMLAWCSGDVWLFSLQTRVPGHLPRLGEGYGTSIAFSPSGKFMACGFNDGSACLWDTKTGKQTVLLSADKQEGKLMRIAFSMDGSLVVTGGHNETIKQWKTQSGDLQKAFEKKGAVNAIAVDSTKPILAIGGLGNKNAIRLWDMTNGNTLALLDTGIIDSLAFSQDGKLLASGSRDKTVRIWEFTTE